MRFKAVRYYYLVRPAVRGESFRVSFLSAVRFSAVYGHYGHYGRGLAGEPPVPAWGGSMIDYD